MNNCKTGRLFDIANSGTLKTFLESSVAPFLSGGKTSTASKDKIMNPNTAVSHEIEPISHHKTPENGRLSLAYSDLREMPNYVIKEYGHNIREMDLSHNRISSLKFLSDLPNIESLVLDDNHLTSQVKVPFCPELHTLWVNDNRIQSLDTFLDSLAKSCPNLKILSMMNNEAAPSYFNGGTYDKYLEYRYYVISCLPRLKYLDYSVVTPEEKMMAKRWFPTPKLRFFKRRRSNKRIQRATGA